MRYGKPNNKKYKIKTRYHGRDLFSQEWSVKVNITPIIGRFKTINAAIIAAKWYVIIHRKGRLENTKVSNKIEI